MFLVQAPQMEYLVFTRFDPRHDGFRGEVKTDVTLDDDGDDEWPEGAPCPHRILAVSRTDAKKYKVFTQYEHCALNGYQSLTENFTVDESYAEFVRGVTKPAVTTGNLRLALHRSWDQIGERMIRDGGFTEVTPSLKRSLLREYIDGERTGNAPRFWLPLAEHEKTVHLLDAFPDEDYE